MQSVNTNNGFKLGGLGFARSAAPAAPTAAPAAAPGVQRDARVGGAASSTPAGNNADPILAAELRLANSYHPDADTFAANLAAASLQELCQTVAG